MTGSPVSSCPRVAQRWTGRGVSRPRQRELDMVFGGAAGVLKRVGSALALAVWSSRAHWRPWRLPARVVRAASIGAQAIIRADEDDVGRSRAADCAL